MQGDSSAACVVEKLKRERKTLAVVESCTGGLISHSVTNIPGASEVYLGGFVVYANALKISLLGVSPEILEKHGAVSEACALAMVEGLFAKTQADYCLATTGIAGPSGGSVEKPVGTVFTAIRKNGLTSCQKWNFSGDRSQIKSQTVVAGLGMVLD